MCCVAWVWVQPGSQLSSENSCRYMHHCLAGFPLSTTTIPKPNCISNQMDNGIPVCYGVPCVVSFSKQPSRNKITNQCVELNHICCILKQNVNDHQHAVKQTSRTLDPKLFLVAPLVSFNFQPLQPTIFAQYGRRSGKSLF